MTLRAPPAWLGWTIAIITCPLWALPVALLIALIWADHTAFKLKRQYCGPWVDRWQDWFAWRPVKLDDGFAETVWLETVRRKAVGSSYNHYIVHERLQPQRS